jgi:DNA invertase Pin-like site-specific DNA recombinase
MAAQNASTPKAYSYLRFSTPEQAKGDSYRRQTEAAEKYAAAHGLELDDTLKLQDLGVSAFRGSNVSVGALGDFMKAVHQGDVAPGSMLLVESFDRISRQAAWRGQALVSGLIASGITVVTLIGEPKAYDADRLEADPFAIFEILFTLMRANEESTTKARRLRSAWSSKRKRATSEKLTTIAPAWLQLSKDRKRFKVLEDRAEVVRRIFAEALEGKGAEAIAVGLNRGGVPVFGRGKHWHRSYIVKILDNPAVVGTFTPHTLEYTDGKRTRVPQAPVEDYFPAVVDAETFQRVQALRLDAGSAQRGRNAGAALQNIFGAVLRCGRCGATMNRVYKGKNNGSPRLVCSAARAGAGTCEYRSVRYPQVEEAFLKNAQRLIAEAPAGERGGPVDAEVARIEGEIWGTEAARDAILEEAMASRKTAGVVRLIEEHDAQLESLRKQRRELEERAAVASGPAIQRTLDELWEAAEAHPLDRQRVNTLLRQAFKGITIDTNAGMLWFDWKQGGELGAIPFAWPEAEEATIIEPPKTATASRESRKGARVKVRKGA